MTTHLHHVSHPAYRPDVDGLRGVAVVSVVVFHAFPDWIRGGFIGVDIFFVISGYLISTIIYQNLQNETFSFLDFYARRIRRIFPALILVLLACYLTGWSLLLPDEYKQLGKHILSGAGFVSNFTLLGEVGYFDNSAETKPLLHLWSLGVEEQFYIIWPVLLFLVWKFNKNLVAIAAGVFILSFLLNINGVKNDPAGVFYFPHTRFWELMAGSVLAWYALNNKNDKMCICRNLSVVLKKKIFNRTCDMDEKWLADIVSFLGASLLILGLFRINKNISFPGAWAALPVLGATLIILAGPDA